MNIKNFSFTSINDAIPVFDLSFGQEILIVTIVGVISALAVTLRLHRHGVHGSVILHKNVVGVCEFILWLVTGVPPAFWIRIHRLHHIESDKKDDPHSPRNTITFLGLKIKGPIATFREYFYLLKPMDYKVQAGLLKEMKNQTNFSKLFYHKLSWLGPIILFTIYLILFGTSGLWMFAVQFLYQPIVAGGMINGLGHSSKEMDSKIKDYSSNLFSFLEKLPKVIYIPIFCLVSIPMTILTGGEWLHHYHHLNQKSSRFTMKRWEFDIGWFVIYLLWTLNLARKVRYFNIKKNELVYLPEKQNK